MWVEIQRGERGDGMDISPFPVLFLMFVSHEWDVPYGMG